MPGPKSRALTRDQVSRLWRFQRSNRYSLPQLKLAMSAPFKWGVLGRALEGERIWVINADFIVDWLD